MDKKKNTQFHEQGQNVYMSEVIVKSERKKHIEK